MALPAAAAKVRHRPGSAAVHKGDGSLGQGSTGTQCWDQPCPPQSVRLGSGEQWALTLLGERRLREGVPPRARSAQRACSVSGTPVTSSLACLATATRQALPAKVGSAARGAVVQAAHPGFHPARCRRNHHHNEGRGAPFMALVQHFKAARGISWPCSMQGGRRGRAELVTHTRPVQRRRLCSWGVGASSLMNGWIRRGCMARSVGPAQAHGEGGRQRSRLAGTRHAW